MGQRSITSNTNSTQGESRHPREFCNSILVKINLAIKVVIW